MSTTLSELADAVRDLAAAVAGLGGDAEEAIRLLEPLAALAPAADAAADGLGQAVAAADAATAALCRRAALAALARAAAAVAPAGYDDAVALRDRLCALLAAEEVVAADAGDAATAAALRDLRAAVSEDLTRRAADLSRLTTLRAPAPLPALVHAWRLWEDPSRADEVTLAAGAEDPNFIAGEFRVRAD